jgi:hypothetical protein
LALSLNNKKVPDPSQCQGQPLPPGSCLRQALAVTKISKLETEKKGPRMGAKELLVGGALSAGYLGPLPGRGPASMYPLTISMFILIKGSKSWLPAFPATGLKAMQMLPTVQTRLTRTM